MAFKKIKPTLSKGTRDFLPDEVLKRNYLFAVIKEVFLRYGFVQIETPAIERLETLTGKYGEEGDRLIFKILNSGDFLSDIPDHLLHQKNTALVLHYVSDKGLRYDLTVPLARYVVQHQDKLFFPFKRFHIGPVWRADRPQRGRYQEFYQCDADVVGSSSLLSEVELLLIFSEVFHKLKLTDIKIHISHRKILFALAEKLGASAIFSRLAVNLDKLDKTDKQNVFNQLLQDGFNEEQLHQIDEFLNIQGESEDILSQLDIYFKDNNIAKEGINDLKFIVSTLKNTKAEALVKIDVSLARGLDYYTGFIAEVRDLSGVMSGSLGSGGRYDNLTEIFGGRNMPGVGISFGVERIYDLLSEKGLFPQDLVSVPVVLFCPLETDCIPTVIILAQTVRDNGFCADVYPSPIKIAKQLDYANKRKIPFVVIVGREELQAGQITLKNMTTGEQSRISAEALISHIKI
ncbi:MAG: histidine--tRNA ligase [Chitinophagales bacterium]|nr:histidine--tRNA ligase [Chitinophagales bacterium]